MQALQVLTSTVRCLPSPEHKYAVDLYAMQHPGVDAGICDAGWHVLLECIHKPVYRTECKDRRILYIVATFGILKTTFLPKMD